MNKFLPLIIALLFCCSADIRSQFYEKPSVPSDNKYLNSFYIEFGGPGVLSVNYDLIINGNSAIRIGTTPNILLDPDTRNSSELYDEEFPIVGIISYSRLFGKRSSKLESGLGIIFGDKLSNDNISNPPALFLNVGYRFVSQNIKGAVFKATFTPFIKDQKLIPWAGISIGYSFSNKN